MMTIAPAKCYVRDDAGALRVGLADVSLDSVVMAFQDGFSAEAIQLQLPALTLEEVYEAITFYLAHQDAVDRYLIQQSSRWQELRDLSHQSSSPLLQRLRSIRHSQVGNQA